jgi:hypothetical protein
VAGSALDSARWSFSGFCANVSSVSARENTAAKDKIINTKRDFLFTNNFV